MTSQKSHLEWIYWRFSWLSVALLYISQHFWAFQCMACLVLSNIPPNYCKLKQPNKLYLQLEVQQRTISVNEHSHASDCCYLDIFEAYFQETENRFQSKHYMKILHVTIIKANILPVNYFGSYYTLAFYQESCKLPFHHVSSPIHSISPLEWEHLNNELWKLINQEWNHTHIYGLWSFWFVFWSIQSFAIINHFLSSSMLCLFIASRNEFLVEPRLKGVQRDFKAISFLILVPVPSYFSAPNSR